MQGEVPEAGAGAGELKKGPWTAAEDEILTEYVRRRGEGNWNAVRRNAGLQRCGKSCRLRWMNHLRPDLKKGSFSPQEELVIARLHAQLGNKWALMASQLPGRTDNEIKNYWNTRVKRHRRAGLPLYPPEMQSFFFSSPPPSPSPSPTAPLQSGRQRRIVPPLAVERPLFAFSASAPASPIVTNNGSNIPLLVPPISQFSFPLSTPASPSTPTAPLLLPLQPLLVRNHELPSNQLALTAAAAAAAADANMVDAMVEELRGGDGSELLVGEARNVDQCGYILPYQLGGAFDGSTAAGINMKSEPQCVNETVDANQILNMISAASPIATDDELALAVQLEQCPLITEENWNIEACPWNNMPGIS